MEHAEAFKTIFHKVDFCVVGGGLAGMFTAISAARRGLKVALMHDRPVLGGNASSEVRMWVGGAHGKNNKETGILEEISLENLYRNPYKVYSIWDSILYGTAMMEPNLLLLLNCSCNDAVMDGQRIHSVKGWQLTTQTWHVVEAGLFADCSGDSILAPLTGAEFRWGREARSEFDEDIAPEEADAKTMGLSCLMQARETTGGRTFIPPDWANKYNHEDFPYRMPNMKSVTENFWYMELGGIQDTIHDSEEIRDELLKVAFGVWDYIKNSGDCDADNWELDWVGFLPGKRESRRYVGDHIMTQNDVRAEGRFEDIVAYGGWSMDDHHPEGFKYPGSPTIYHPAPSPYGIAYRCLYSKNISNLLFAGRNLSATHTAMSSTRLMATCALMGQAIGTAASLAIGENMTPREVYLHRINELKQALMEDDCHLPWNARRMPELTASARLTTSEGDGEPLRDGIDRPTGNVDHGWKAAPGAWVQYELEDASPVRQIRIVFDSDLERETISTRYVAHLSQMGCNIFLDMDPGTMPQTLVKAFRVEGLDSSGNWFIISQMENNHQRLVRITTSVTVKAVRLIPEKTWGSDSIHLFAFDVR
jgi:hypothetical protein